MPGDESKQHTPPCATLQVALAEIKWLKEEQRTQADAVGGIRTELNDLRKEIGGLATSTNRQFIALLTTTVITLASILAGLLYIILNQGLKP
jgi:hypothetical protein